MCCDVRHQKSDMQIVHEPRGRQRSLRNASTDDSDFQPRIPRQTYYAILYEQYSHYGAHRKVQGSHKAGITPSTHQSRGA
jgi:hypothetical protein